MASCNKTFGEPSSSLAEQVLRSSISIRAAQSRPTSRGIAAQTEEQSTQVKDECRSSVTESSNCPIEGENTIAQIERLGRMRPEQFKSAYAEVGFAFSICMSQIL